MPAEDFALAFGPCAAAAAIADRLVTRDQIEQGLRDNTAQSTQAQLKELAEELRVFARGRGMASSTKARVA